MYDLTTSPRISSVLNAHCLEPDLIGLPTFELSRLKISRNIDESLPDNLRLGHLVEKIVSRLISISSNYKLLYENIQVAQNNTTIGEIDFIIQEVDSGTIIHLELAYKFYLYDASISSETINNWIGPNRNDTLQKKIDKTRTKQFPLLHHQATQAQFPELNNTQVSQTMCLLASLYLPYGYSEEIDPRYMPAIKGFYLTQQELNLYDHTGKLYYLPSKTEWGIDPEHNQSWSDFEHILQPIESSMKEKRSILCWEKNGTSYQSFFIVCW